MKTTIEKIHGKAYTVVWHDDVQSFNGTMMATHTGFVWHIGSKCVATLLPALPRHPKPEDAQLLYRYMADGIKPEFKWRNGRGFFVGASIVNIAGSKNSPVWLVETPRHITRLFSEFPNTEGWEITHATFNGERVDVAIEG